MLMPPVIISTGKAVNLYTATQMQRISNGDANIRRRQCPRSGKQAGRSKPEPHSRQELAARNMALVRARRNMARALRNMRKGM